MNDFLAIHRSAKFSVTILGVGLSLTALLNSAHAVGQTWNDGGPSDVWSTSALNWSGGVAWTNGNNAVFSALVGETVEVDGTVSAVGLTSNYSAISLTTGYTIADANADGLLNLSASGGGATTAKPIYTATGSNTISANILLSGSSGTGGGRVFSPGTSLTISGNISESDQAKFLSFSGGGILTLSGTNTFTGGVAVANGSSTLNINSASALGTGALSYNAGSSALNINNTSGAAVILLNNNNVNLSSATAGTSSANSLIFSGSNNLGFGSGIVTMSNANKAISVTAGRLSVGGFAEDATPRSLFKNGEGTLEVTGSSAYSGSTTVTAGTLLLNNPAGSATGSGVLQVGTAVSGTTTLGGNGSVAGAVTIGNGAGTADTLLTAGATTASGSVGKFTILSSLTLASDARVVLDITGAGTRGTAYDAIDVGSLTYGGSIALNITTGIGAGTYDLFAITGAATQGLSSIVFTGGTYVSTWSETTPTSGVWTSTSGASTFTFTESTGDLQVVVPEPSVCLLVGMASGLVLLRIRRRTTR